MAMMMLKIKGYEMKVAAAGMPLPLIWRAADRRVEEVDLKGMPLGSFARFPHREKEITLNPGDCVILMSDGLPERFNTEGETLDYPTVAKLVEQSGDKSPKEMIEYLLKCGEKWANGRPQDDDMTFVALKVK